MKVAPGHEPASRGHRSGSIPTLRYAAIIAAGKHVVSDKPLGEIRSMLDARFGEWAAPAVATGSKSFAAPLPKPTPRIVLIDRPQSPQSLIYAGVPLSMSGTDDLVTLVAANEILGSDFLSRINTEIRERRGWSYGLNGNLHMREQRVPYIISAPVQADRTGDSIRVLTEQINAFNTSNGVSEAEHVKALPGNPYDGHTLKTVIPDMEAMIGNTIERILAEWTKRYDGKSEKR